MTVATHLARRVRKISRETELPALVGAVEYNTGQGVGAHVQVAGANAAEIEFIALGILRMLEGDLTGVAVDCEECSARWRRVSAAAAILAEGYGDGVSPKGRC
ncbi:hypothetical protein BBAL3_1925 [Brevundimonas sp. BAL3]|uniref:hypothetical protein n=1 Tax=Brevundimonas sp. BAL3 TaxID=391600 RepID=UPI00017EBEAC|nr:hypothetical protein [Brevundimonas sp. BAL3]EDX80768.1 hypothetical protein BBAL3_1925 [Brevundimonas sp. BAL3]